MIEVLNDRALFLPQGGTGPHIFLKAGEFLLLLVYVYSLGCLSVPSHFLFQNNSLVPSRPKPSSPLTFFTRQSPSLLFLELLRNNDGVSHGEKSDQT